MIRFHFLMTSFLLILDWSAGGFLTVGEYVAILLFATPLLELDGGKVGILMGLEDVLNFRDSSLTLWGAS